MKGYKAMIRDRCPYVVNLALKWCTEFGRLVNLQCDPEDRISYKVKERWIERVYKENVAIYTTSDDKDSAVRKALGIHKGKQEFNFADSINMGNINPKFERGELNFWKWVQTWVEWFQKHYKYIECIYQVSNAFNENCKEYIRNNAGVDEYLDGFTKYIERTFNQK